MRAIKFRAWDMDVNTMRKDVTGFEGIAGLMDGMFIDGDFRSIVRGEIVPMQFTGLLDKNGREIYEGDVVKLQVNQHIWFYQIGCSGFDGVNLCAIGIRDNVTIDDETDTYTYQMTDIRAGLTRPIPPGCEVVGNIHENPVLLEGA